MKKRMLSLCVIIALLFTMLPQVVLTTYATKADSGKLGDNLTWELEDRVLTISGSGAMCDFYSPEDGTYEDERDRLSHTTSPWSPYQEEITSVVITPGVTSIGQMAFYGCKNITEIAIPDGVYSIGSYAFMNCSSLAEIVLPDSILSIGERAFLGCDVLSYLELPNKLTILENGVFEECSQLEVVISESVSAFADGPTARKNLGGLQSCRRITACPENPYFSSDEYGVLYNKSRTELICMPSSVVQYAVPEGVTSIGAFACEYCNLETIDFPDSLVSIGNFAFGSSYELRSVTIPGNVKTIGNAAFIVCYNLEELILSDGIESIGGSAFSYCDSLETVSIPASINQIGSAAFSACDNIDGIWVDEDNLFYCNDNSGALYNKDKSELLQAPYWTKSVEYLIPPNVCSIGSSAFSDYECLEKIVIPDSVSTINESAFSNCSSLLEVYFLGDAPTIEDNSFSWVNANVMYKTDNSSWTYSVMQNYGGELTWIATDVPNFYGFSINKDGWSFANAAQSFAAEPVSSADDYFIPRERYDDLFGSSYVDSTEGLYTEEWGGNCAGMSATAILFFLDSLDWESIDAEYSEDFTTPNDFYRTVNLHNKSQSYYPAIGNDTEVTRLIEAYQLYINAIDKSRLIENLEKTYFEADVTEKKTLFGSEYIVNHVSDGTYIATMLEEFQEAYDENKPLLIELQANNFGHGIVSRTDLKPEDMGDGWWRVYVYDPNKPYINESVTSTVSGVEAEPKYTFGCNTLVDNGGDIYLELNPSLNQWRYCTSVNSNSSDSYIGSSPLGELLWKTYYHDATPENENDDEGKKNNAKIPDFFYTIDLTDLSMEDFANPHFDSVSAWIPENDLAVAIDGKTDCSIYASTGELVAIVEDGDAFVLTDVGSYDAYIGQTEDGSSSGGKIYLPTDTYTVYYTSGAVQFLGNSNVISFSCEGGAELTVDIALNSLQIIAQEDGIATVKCANVTSTDECSYVNTEGALVTGETFTIAYSDENKVEASTDSKDGEFQLYQKDADQEEAVATKVIKSSSLWWLWIVGGVVVVGIVLFILLKKKKPNA